MSRRIGRRVACRVPRTGTRRMIATLHHSLLAIALVTLLELAVIARILLRPHRDPASRIAWVVVVGVLPLLGMFAYLLLGEVSIGRRRVARLHAVLERMPPFPSRPAGDGADLVAAIPERYRHLFELGRSISRFDPVGGNTARLLADSNATIDAMVADIDAAQGSRPCAVLHLAAGPQRPQGRRGPEARGRPRRDLPGHGR